MDIDWQEMFAFSMPPFELFVRGSVMYGFLLFAFRSFLKRDIGAVGIADVLLLVLVADAAQNAMSAEYRSVGDGLVLVSTILGWNVLLDYLAYRFPALRRLLQARPLRLVQEGRILHRNLQKEFISEEELMAKLREHGIADVADVKMAFMESNGSITAIRRDGADQDGPSRPSPPA